LGFFFFELFLVYDRARNDSKISFLIRLISATPLANDEGYFSLLENPPTLTEMGHFFQEQRGILEDYILNRSK
jgi:hypothetical protein